MEDDFNDFSELSAGDTSIALRRCFAQVAAERDQLRAEVERLRGELSDALAASGANAKAWQDAVCDEAVKRSQLLAEIGLTEQQRDAVTARAEAAEKERDEWRTKALDVEKHPAVVALLRERNEAQDLLAGMRGALEEVLKSAYPHPVEHPTMTAAWKIGHAALALTPASAVNRIKAEALRALQADDTFTECTGTREGHTAIQKALAVRIATAEEKEAANGR